MSVSNQEFDKQLLGRHRKSQIFLTICTIATWFGIVILGILLVSVAYRATGWLDWQFVTSYGSRKPEQAGVFAGIIGSIWVMVFTALFAIPVGVCAAVFLEEYARDNWFTRFIRLNIANLAGVPSIVYGILGLTVFVRVMNLGTSILAGALTLSLLVLPIVIIACQEALRAVPQSIRHGALALGATKWQSIRTQVLPAAIPGIMTGIILSLSRAIGETAPLIVVGAATGIFFAPGDIESWTGEKGLLNRPQAIQDVPLSDYTVIPMQIFDWVALQPKEDFRRYVAAAGITVLLSILLVMNGIAVYIRHRFQKNLNW